MTRQPLVVDEIFEDAPLAPRQRQHLAGTSGSRPSENTRSWPDQVPSPLGLDPAADRFDARQDLAHMDGLAHHVVDAGGKQIQRLLQGLVVVHGNDGRD